MTSKFRRGHNKNIVLLKADVSDLQDSLLDVKTSTSNTNIINVINPLSADLDMNAKDILNCDNIDTKTLTTSNITPAAGLINVQGDILFNRQGSIYDTNAIRTGAFIVNNIIKNTVNPGIHTEIKILSNLDLNTNNNITGVNNIETKTINGGEILTNPLSTDLNLAGRTIYNVGAISTDSLNSNADGAPIYINTNIDMLGVDIVDVGRVETGQIRILDEIDLNNTGKIYGCTEVFTNDVYSKRILKNYVATAEDIQMEKIRMLENINMDNNSIENVNVLTTNSITSDQAFIAVNKGIVMNGNSISISGAGGIYTETADVSNKIELGLSGQILNGALVQTAELQTDTIKSVNPSTADIAVMNNMITMDIRPDVTDFRNIGTATHAYDRMTANAFDTTAINAFPGYTQIIINNDLNLDTTNKIKNIFTTETKNLDALIPGGTINVLSNLDLKTTKNIIGVNLIEALNITSTGTITSTIINNSGILRSGGIVQDTAITAYGQIKRDGAPLIVNVPLSPNPSLQLTFNNLILSPHNTQTNATTITILHEGTYRVVVSLVGIMDADRQMDLFLRKNGINISFVFLSRLGNRSIEATINELIDMNIGDVITIAIQARDAAFTFAYHSGLLQVQRIRKNTL